MFFFVCSWNCTVFDYNSLNIETKYVQEKASYRITVTQCYDIICTRVRIHHTSYISLRYLQLFPNV